MAFSEDHIKCTLIYVDMYYYYLNKVLVYGDEGDASDVDVGWRRRLVIVVGNDCCSTAVIDSCSSAVFSSSRLFCTHRFKIGT